MSQKALKPDEVQALLKGCGRGIAGIRNRALISSMWSGGLRCGEALSLMPSDLDPENETVELHGTKNGEDRLVWVREWAYIERWLDRRAALGLNGRHPVFCTIAEPNRGLKLNSSYVRRAVYRAGARAGLDDGDAYLPSGHKKHRIHPHALRHSHAVELAMSRAPAVAIMDQLGHSSLHTTTTYLRRIAPQERIDALKQAMANREGVEG